MQRGAFISIEGIEGVGKSTHVAAVAQGIVEAGFGCVSTREPGGSPFAEQIRQLVLVNTEEAVSADCELLLMSAARAQHLAVTIEPALLRGDWVVSDRFVDATFAYQGGGRGIALERIAELTDWTVGGVRPDLTLLLDAPVETAMARIEKRAELDRFEQEQLNFFDAVRAAYLARAAADPGRIKVINAAQSLEAVAAAVTDHLNTFIAHHVQV